MLCLVHYYSLSNFNLNGYTSILCVQSWKNYNGFGSLGLVLAVHFWLCFVKCFLWLFSVFILNFHLYISIWIFYSVSVLEKYIRELVPFCGVFFADWVQNMYIKMV